MEAGTVVDAKSGHTGVVRKVDEDAGLILMQVKPGVTMWAFLDEVSIRKAAPKRKAPAARSAPQALPSGADADGGEPGYAIGTLRWTEDYVFPTLRSPPWRGSPPEELHGWKEYIADRGIALEPNTPVFASALDGLSYPLSILHAFELLERRAPAHLPKLGEEVTLVLMGASRKVEERLLYETRYWEELVHYPHVFAHPTRVKLLLAGPDIKRHGDERVFTPRLRSACFRGSLGAALDAHRCDPATAVLVGFNTGSGSGIADVMASWAHDLRAVVAAGYLAIFTCVNDYSDMVGEKLLHSVLGSRVLLPFRRNPFYAVSVWMNPTVAPGQAHPHWSRGNHAVYAVRGLDRARSGEGGESAEAFEARIAELAERLIREQKVTHAP